MMVENWKIKSNPVNKIGNSQKAKNKLEKNSKKTKYEFLKSPENVPPMALRRSSLDCCVNGGEHRAGIELANFNGSGVEDGRVHQGQNDDYEKTQIAQLI